MELTYKNERTLLILMMGVSLLFWTALIATVPVPGMLFLAFLVLAFVFIRSALGAWLKGTGVKITYQQFPDLRARVDACCGRLGLLDNPPAYLLQAHGGLDAIARRILSSRFIILDSAIVEALEDKPEAINFYIGHEIGHIRRQHMRWAPLLMPAAVLPLLGAAYSRARAYTCDRYGFLACDSLHSAEQGLAALAAGGRRRGQLSVAEYAGQASDAAGFWMSFHELVSDRPWLVKRMAAVHALATGRRIAVPSRHALAFMTALFVPRTGVMGGMGGLLVLLAALGIAGAGLLPAYRENREQQRIAGAVEVGKDATAAVERYYYINGRNPDSLSEAGFALDDPGRAVVAVQLDAGGVVRVFPSAYAWRSKSIAFVPVQGADHKLSWLCGSSQIPAHLLPAECRDN
jgi:Zn-dependent protease with chaperone function/type II secretory pathway pseudopilin PulG